jgi:hypothetical protein
MMGIVQIRAWNVVAQIEMPREGVFNGTDYFANYLLLFDASLEV